MTLRLGIALLLYALGAPLLTQDSAASLADRGHWKRARLLAESRLKANGNDAEALWLLSRVKLAFRDPDAALPLAEKAVALDAANVGYRWQLAEVVGELASTASVFRQMGLARRFKKEAEAVVAINPAHIEALTGLMIFHLRAPGIVGGDKKRAEELVRQISGIDKAQGFLAQARLALESKQPDQVEGLYVKAVEANPSLFEAHTGLASIYSTQQKWPLAEKEALAAKRIDPDRAGPYQMLAGVYAMQERWGELDAILADVEKRVPDNLGPHLRAAGALLTTGKDLQRAERYARKYLAQEPEPTGAPVGLAHWRLGLILEKQGRKADAIAEMETAHRLDSKFEPARKDLKRLRP